VMRVLTMEETQQVSGGSCAELDSFLWASFGGAMGGFLRGAGGGPLSAVGGAIFGGAITGAMYLISHDGPCMS